MEHFQKAIDQSLETFKHNPDQKALCTPFENNQNPLTKLQHLGRTFLESSETLIEPFQTTLLDPFGNP